MIHYKIVRKLEEYDQRVGKITKYAELESLRLETANKIAQLVDPEFIKRERSQIDERWNQFMLKLSRLSSPDHDIAPSQMMLFSNKSRNEL